MFDSWITYLIIISGLGIFVFLVYLLLHRACPGIIKIRRTLFPFATKGKGDLNVSLNETLKALGYAYDQRQNIFYSILDPWQKKFGYCRVYDEAAAPIGMIIDCEPVCFNYDGKKWLIEFWKGQYDMTTGCEIGIYTSERPELNIPGIFKGTFYDCAEEKDYLSMACSLKKNGRVILVRQGLHWWLTGFKLGYFSEPSELVMNIGITLKNREMRNAFLNGLREAGYSNYEITVRDNTVSLMFSDPHTPQPLSRSKVTDEIIQKKNKFLCDQFNEVTKGCTTLRDKLKTVQEKSPELFTHILRLGRPRQLYGLYDLIGSLK